MAAFGDLRHRLPGPPPWAASCSVTTATSSAARNCCSSAWYSSAWPDVPDGLPADLAQIGYLAPILLVVLRFLQGFAVGGEWGGAVLLVAEHSPNRSRGFWASWPQAGVPVGNMLATVVLLLLNGTLSADAFLSWGWRVAFWLSAVVVLIGYYIRTKVTDAPIFVAAQQEAEQIKASSFSAIEVLKRYPRGVFTAMGLRFGENIMYYLVVTFSITYLKEHVHSDTSDILWWLLIAHTVHLVAIPTVGALSDRYGRRPVYFFGAVGAAMLGLLRLSDDGQRSVSAGDRGASRLAW